jgi:hypothetical protein
VAGPGRAPSVASPPRRRSASGRAGRGWSAREQEPLRQRHQSARVHDERAPLSLARADERHGEPRAELGRPGLLGGEHRSAPRSSVKPRSCSVPKRRRGGPYASSSVTSTAPPPRSRRRCAAASPAPRHRRRRRGGGSR